VCVWGGAGGRACSRIHRLHVALELIGYKQVVLRDIMTPTSLQILLVFDKADSSRKSIRVLLRLVIW
jgi:hypothetical protein